MSLWSSLKKSVSSAASTVGSKLSDFKDYASDVASNPSIYTVIPGSKNTWLGDSFNSFGQNFSPNAFQQGAKDLLENVSGQQAQAQYEQSREDAWNQFNQQMDYARHSYQYMAEDMAAAGMNPLSSLGATPASGPSGNVASPTASSSAGGLGAIASFISPILGAIVSRANNADDNAAKKEIAKIAAGPQSKNAEANAKNAETNAAVGAATVQEKQENTRGKKLENDYSERTGITNLTPTASASVRDAVAIADSVAKANEKAGNPFSQENLGRNEKLFRDVIGSSNGRNGSGNFTKNYLAWIFQTRKTGVSFEEYMALKFPKQFNAYAASRGNGHE